MRFWRDEDDSSEEDGDYVKGENVEGCAEGKREDNGEGGTGVVGRREGEDDSREHQGEVGANVEGKENSGVGVGADMNDADQEREK